MGGTDWPFSSNYSEFLRTVRVYFSLCCKVLEFCKKINMPKHSQVNYGAADVVLMTVS